MLRAQTTTTCTAGIPTRPGSLCQLLAPRTQCYEWPIHHSSNGKIATAELHLWRQNTHYFSIFSIENAQHVMLFLWIGSQNDRMLLCVSGRGEHGQDQDWISCRILAIFSDQDWIWIFIFEKNWIRT